MDGMIIHRNRAAVKIDFPFRLNAIPDRPASLPDEKFHKLQELVKKKGHLKSAPGGF